MHSRAETALDLTGFSTTAARFFETKFLSAATALAAAREGGFLLAFHAEDTAQQVVANGPSGEVYRY